MNGGANAASLQERCAEANALLTALFQELDDGKQPDWELLRNRPTLRLERASWEDLAALIQDGSAEALSNLGRLPLDIKEYRRYREEVISRNYTSVTDYLYVKVFGLPTVVGADGRLAALVPPDFTEVQRTVWAENDFPYALEDGIEHHNIWASRPLTAEQLRAEVEARRRGYESLHFVNPTALMSVPGIWHAHIISRRAPDCGAEQVRRGGDGA